MTYSIVILPINYGCFLNYTSSCLPADLGGGSVKFGVVDLCELHQLVQDSTLSNRMSTMLSHYLGDLLKVLEEKQYLLTVKIHNILISESIPDCDINMQFICCSGSLGRSNDFSSNNRIMCTIADILSRPDYILIMMCHLCTILLYTLMCMIRCFSHQLSKGSRCNQA